MYPTGPGVSSDVVVEGGFPSTGTVVVPRKIRIEAFYTSEYQCLKPNVCSPSILSFFLRESENTIKFNRTKIGTNRKKSTLSTFSHKTKN